MELINYNIKFDRREQELYKYFIERIKYVTCMDGANVGEHV